MHRLLKTTYGRKKFSWYFVISLILWVLIYGSAFGELTEQEISTLEEQAEIEGWSFSVGKNSATNYSLEDICGLKIPDNWPDKANYKTLISPQDLPTSFDWRDSTTLPVVKHQGGCGSCWAFSTVGALECNIKLIDGIEVDLSEQWLVSCNSDGWDCDGGWYAHDYHLWKTDPCDSTGAVMESYFTYAADDLPCNCPYPHRYYIESWAYIGNSYTVPSISAMKQAIIDFGPICVGIYANSAMQAYTGGIFNSCENEDINHAVVLVGWDDSQGTGGVWILRNSWGTGWGEDDGYMRIEYGCSQVGYGACYIEYAGTPALAFDYPSGIPETLTPAQTTAFDVVVSGVGSGLPVSGSGQLHYSLNGGIVQTVSMTEVSTNQYQAVLPATSCGDLLEFYVSAEEVSSGSIYDPDPVSPNKAVPVTGIVTVLNENFDTDPGWTTEGLWAFGQPTGGGGAYGGPDPTSGYTGNNVYGYNLNGDYENSLAEQDLTTTAIDCSGLVNVHLKFWRWLGVENSVYDHAYIRVSNDGTTWTTVWQNVAEYADDTWHEIDLNISDIADGQSIVYIRWIMGETDGGWTYCGWNIDDILVTAYECGEQADSDEDGIPDLTDNCPAIPNEYQEDADGDDIGDACDECTDTDDDGYGNSGYSANTCPDDNCPDVANPEQTDTDDDGIGDACDECFDTDNDGYGNPGYPANTCPDDNCSDVANPEQTDADADGIGDICDECTDTDNDGYGNPGYVANTCPEDNCPDIANPEQTDTDVDGIGDACDECTDTDNDGYGNPGYPANTCPDDNCPDNANPDQTDTDGDNIGDACCCVGIRGNVNADEEESLNIADVTFLVAYCFGSGPTPACPAEGNVNADPEGTINISDITALVSYCFGGGPSPVSCP